MIGTKMHKETAREFPAMTRNELKTEWNVARACFHEALVANTATDKIYQTAASHLNAIERLIKKGEYRQGVADRKAAKSAPHKL